MDKPEIISKIIKLLSVTPHDTGHILLVKIPTIASILDSLPLDILLTLSQRLPETPPPLESPEWIIWFKATCDKYQIRREKFVANANIDRGDLSKFEANKLNFSTTKRKRLLQVINDETGLLF